MPNSKTKQPIIEVQSKHSVSKQEVEVYGTVLANGTMMECLYQEDAQEQCFLAIAEPDSPLKFVDSFSSGGHLYIPAKNARDACRRKSLVLASGVNDHDNLPSLLRQLRNLIVQYVDLDPYDTSLIANYALWTWVWDAWNPFPYLRFKGEPGTGKTRCLEVLREICYRSIDLGVCPTKSAIFRMNDMIQGTLFIDEADYDDNLKSDLMKVLNAGYVKQGKITLSEPVGNNGDWRPKAYIVGSPKVLANRQAFRDPALETRCLTVHTVSKKVRKDIPANLPKQFFAESALLRNKLLDWRLKEFQSVDTSDHELEGIDGRTKQIGLPIYNVSPDADFKREFVARLRQRGRELKEEDPIQIVLRALAETSTRACNGYVPLKDICEAAVRIGISRDVSSWNFQPKRTAELVRGLQFEIVRHGDGRVVYVDSALLHEQLGELGMDDDASDASDAEREVEVCSKAA